jgi:hypothetical protein
MNAKTVVCGAIVFGLASAALSIDDTKLAAKAYRWVAVDGPYACHSKEDLRQITKHHTDEIAFQMVDQVRAYYLVSGTIVELVQEDSLSGMSQIHIAGITSNLLTFTRFLNKRPLTDPFGVIETPENSGPISPQTLSFSNMREWAAATVGPGVSPESTASPPARTAPTVQL